MGESIIYPGYTICDNEGDRRHSHSPHEAYGNDCDEKADEIKEAIYGKMVRGITTVPAKGAFTNEQKEMMIIVITRYELYDLEKIVKEVDPKAFTNIVQTTGIFGFFRKD